MKGKCDNCGALFEGFIKEELTFCSPECENEWWKNNVSGYENHEADKSLYVNVKIIGGKNENIKRNK